MSGSYKVPDKMDNLARIFNMEPFEIEFDDNFFDDVEDFSELSRREALKRNKKIVKCPKCGLEGNEPNMLRWHFDNCSTVFKNCLYCGDIIPRQNIKPFLYNEKKYCNRNCYMKSKLGKSPIVMTAEVKLKISISAKSQSKIRSDRMKKNKVWEYSSESRKNNNNKKG